MAILPPDPVFCLKGDMGHIHSLCFPNNPNSNYTTQLLAASENGFVYFWDLQTNRLQHKQSMGESIQAIHSTPNAIITQERAGKVKKYALTNSGYIHTTDYAIMGGYCKSILLEDRLFVPQTNSTVDILSLDFEPLSRLEPELENLGHLMCLQKVELNGRAYILGGYETGDVVLWDSTTHRRCSHLKLREYITSLTFDPISGRGIVGNASNALQVFTIDGSFNIRLKCEIVVTNEGCNVVRLRDDRKIFVSGGWDGGLRVFSWKSLRLLAVLNEHKKAVTDVQFSGKVVQFWGERIIAAGGADGLITLWNLYN